MTTEMLLVTQICLAPLAALVILALPRSLDRIKEWLAVAAAALNLVAVLRTVGEDYVLSVPWAFDGIDFSLRLYHTATFMTVAAAGFGLLVTLYSLPFMREHKHLGLYYALVLITLGFVNGAVLANNLVVMLFFWEGLLGTLFGMIAIGHDGAWRTATKAFIIAGVADLCLMIGIALTFVEARTVVMTEIHLPLEGGAAFAFVMLMIGAIAKGGSMPFHSWIPDAALDAPLPFMAFLPASIEKLLGIYFLSRISLDLFELRPESWVSTLMMIVGAMTLLLAVSMALVQKDFKRLLAFHAISQVGYMILGIGTATVFGVVGGLFHMINNTLYKSCLFFTGGAVERQAGSTDLAKLGGLGRRMPVTFGCFVVSALSISGVPPFNGFFSKELIYDGALERGYVYYLVAIVGSFLTAASFLKLGHAAFLGPRQRKRDRVREAPLEMLAPMLLIAGVCLLFGFYNVLPIETLIEPMLPKHLIAEAEHVGHSLAGFPANGVLVGTTVAVLLGALLNHLFGAWLNGGGLHAVDHIHHGPGLRWLFERASRRWFDPYEIFLKGVNAFAWLAFRVDRGIDWLYGFSARLSGWTSQGIRLAHTGNTSAYVLWSLLGAATVLGYLLALS